MEDIAERGDKKSKLAQKNRKISNGNSIKTLIRVGKVREMKSEAEIPSFIEGSNQANKKPIKRGKIS